MSNSNKPKNVDFGTMERKLREMGVSGSLEHLKASKAVTPKREHVPQESRSTEVMATASSPVVTTNEIEQERQPSDWCNYIFGTLLSIYESTWIKSYGRRPTGRFSTLRIV